jgi:GTPase SAR1 family protein
MAQNICDKMLAVSIVVVGDSRSGKTQLINRFASGCFSEVRIIILLRSNVSFN